ncbi:S-type anion channel SLAH1 [Ananas comosus]|uniref:S-type anion channel SLAH1 n=1 Tax=Ananas comosus TaxID=4615 RepID=A0A199VUL9_ANACO|nr:S-type anion channel SLAH1 [Ananas comosus]
MEHRYSENLHPPGEEHVQKALMQKLSVLTRFHAGYFRISLSLCGQALLWKTLSAADPRALHFILHLLPVAAFDVLWSFALSSLVVLCALYAIRCTCRFECFKAELGHHIGVNYLFAPWASALLLLQCASSPFLRPESPAYHVLWWVFAVPILVLDVKVYGQWFIRGRRYCLSAVANPTSQMTVIANMAAAAAAATTDMKESTMCMFTVGLAHYLVLFVTLYQRLAGSESLLPALLRPVFFLFFAAPATASVAWAAISGSGGFDTAAKMLFFLSFFLFLCLVSRPMLFWRSMRTFSLAWWAYSFPLTVLALAAEKYAQEVKGGVPNAIMLVLSLVSALVTVALILLSAFNPALLVPQRDPFLPQPSIPS